MDSLCTPRRRPCPGGRGGMEEITVRTILRGIARSGVGSAGSVTQELQRWSDADRVSLLFRTAFRRGLIMTTGSDPMTGELLWRLTDEGEAVLRRQGEPD